MMCDLRRIATLVIFAVCLSLTSSFAFATRSYELTVIAQTGKAGLVSIQDGVSINDKGQVAFGGDVSGGVGIFVGDGKSDPVNITPLFASDPRRRLGRYLQINNLGQVVAIDRTTTAPILSILRRWDSSTPGTFTTIARGHSDCGFIESCPKVFGSLLYTYNSILGASSINNNSQVVFSALSGVTAGTLVLSSPSVSGSGFNEIPFGSTALLRPMLDDGGQVVVKNGSEIASPIDILHNNLSLSQVIADSAHWLRLGRMPGTSDQGTTVVFYGNLSVAGAAALGLPAGEGIFASVLVGTERILTRVAGLDGDSKFSAFDPDGRVAVNEARTIVYAAFDKLGTKGVYTSQLSFFTDRRGPKPVIPVDGNPTLVIAQGDTVPSVGTITGLGLYDPIDNAGDVAFWASTAAGSAVIRADRVCAEQDYATPETATYINQYNAGEFLNLPLSSKGPKGTWTPRKGGNACGPSSLVMLVNAVKRVDRRVKRGNLVTAYTASMMHMPEDLKDNMFVYSKGLSHALSLGYAEAATLNGDRATLDSYLDQGIPVVTGTKFSTSQHYKLGGGHVVLFLGRTSMGDYVVNDPAGNYFASAIGHYGINKCGELAVYPKAVIDSIPDLLNTVGGRMLVVPLKADVDPEVLYVSFDVLGKVSPDVSLWLVDTEGNRAGFLPADIKVTEIPNSRVIVEELTTTDPESEEADLSGPETTHYSILVVSPPSGVTALVSASKATGLKMKTIRYLDGNVISDMTTSANLSDGETRLLVLRSAPVPGVVGKPKATAQASIIAAGFTVGAVADEYSSIIPAGSIIRQEPSAGSVYGLGTSVDLVVSLAPALKGDLNGDGRVDCGDLLIVRASFGKRAGQAGFDIRADINRDGVVDVKDLAIVSQNLPAGTRCP